MKRVTFTFLFLLFAESTFAQSPEAINYQGVARDASDAALTNRAISLRISILSGSTSGTIEYQETQNPTTNSLGLFTLKIGQGTVTMGTFSNIDWAGNAHFVRIEMDPAGGSSYNVIGTSELLSVPYALHATTVTNDAVDDADADPSNELQTLSLSGDTLSISSGNQVALPSDADSDPQNEIQTLSVSGNMLTISGSNTVTLTDNVIDNDADPTNEIQSLSVSGDSIRLSGSNAVGLPGDGDWTDGPDGWYNLSDNFGIGVDTPRTRLQVNSTVSNLTAAITARSAILGTIGQVGVDGRTNHFGIPELDISGLEIGILGISVGSSTTDNYGVYGFSNFWGGYFSNSTNLNDFVRLGGSSNALQIVDGNQASGRVLTSDAAGNASWQAINIPTAVWTDQGATVRPRSGESVISGGDFTTSAANGVINAGGSTDPDANVIGDTNPTTATQQRATADEDLWIQDDLEVRGQAYKIGTTWLAPSDARLKREIKPFTDGLSHVLQINPVRYKYNEKVGLYDRQDEEFVGIIAQDMQKIAPYMVEEVPLGRKEREGKDGKIEVVNEGENYLIYDANAMDYLLVNAIKEQQQLIDQQQQLIKALEARIEQLEQK